MASPRSMDLRAQVLAAYDRGMKTSQVSQTYGISPACARRWKQRRREHGETRPRPMGGSRGGKIDPGLLAEQVQQTPDATLRELADAMGVVCTTGAVSQRLKKLRITRKKKRSAPPSRSAPTSSSSGIAGARCSGACRPAA